jgi:hypothetical protein
MNRRSGHLLYVTRVTKANKKALEKGFWKLFIIIPNNGFSAYFFRKASL